MLWKLLSVLLLGLSLFLGYRYQSLGGQLTMTESRALAAQGWLDLRDHPQAVERAALVAIESISIPR